MMGITDSWLKSSRRTRETLWETWECWHRAMSTSTRGFHIILSSWRISRDTRNSGPWISSPQMVMGYVLNFLPKCRKFFFKVTISKISKFHYLISLNIQQPEPTTWSTRRHTDYHTQVGDHGGAIEDFIHICNILGAKPWFNIPHAADNDYVSHFAQLAKQLVRPDLDVSLALVSPCCS